MSKEKEFTAHHTKNNDRVSQNNAPHRERGNVLPAAGIVGTVEQAEVVEGPTAVHPGYGAGSLGPLAPPEGGAGHIYSQSTVH